MLVQEDNPRACMGMHVSPDLPLLLSLRRAIHQAMLRPRALLDGGGLVVAEIALEDLAARAHDLHLRLSVHSVSKVSQSTFGWAPQVARGPVADESRKHQGCASVGCMRKGSAWVLPWGNLPDAHGCLCSSQVQA